MSAGSPWLPALLEALLCCASQMQGLWDQFLNFWKLCRQQRLLHHGFHLLPNDLEPASLATLCREPWVCAPSLPGCVAGTTTSVHGHTEDPRALSQGAPWCRSPPVKANVWCCAQLSPAGMRGGVGQVPAELTTHLAQSLPSAKGELGGGQAVSCGCCPALLHTRKEPTSSSCEYCPLLRPLSCTTSCRARPRPSP